MKKSNYTLTITDALADLESRRQRLEAARDVHAWLTDCYREHCMKWDRELADNGNDFAAQYREYTDEEAAERWDADEFQMERDMMKDIIERFLESVVNDK